MSKHNHNHNDYNYTPYASLDYYELSSALSQGLGNIPYDNSDGTWLNWMGLLWGVVDEEEHTIDYYIKALGLTDGRLARKEETKHVEQLYRNYRREVENWSEERGIEKLEHMINELLVYSRLGYSFEEIEDGALIIQKQGGIIYEKN